MSICTHTKRVEDCTACDARAAAEKSVCSNGLLPCPFCGGIDLEFDAAGMPLEDNTDITEWVNCNTCGASGPDGYSPSQKWNERAG